jgi:hypothetical protein
MRALGLVLVVAGIVGLALGGVQVTRKEKVADIGPLEISQSKTERIPIAPVAAGAAVIAGIALIALGGRKRA